MFENDNCGCNNPYNNPGFNNSNSCCGNNNNLIWLILILLVLFASNRNF